MEILEEVQEKNQRKIRDLLRPEWILGLIILLQLVLLVFMVVYSLPTILGKEPDPETLIHQSHLNEQIPEETEAPTEETEPEETTEPTIPPEANPYGRLDFQYNRNNYLLCQEQDSYPGIDVSAFQGQIDWQKVADSGIQFAIVRLGYRGYGKAGKLVEDEYAQDNLKGATEAGLPIGAYFFSQALDIEEADEEIEYMLEILGDYETSVFTVDPCQLSAVTFSKPCT